MNQLDSRNFYTLLPSPNLDNKVSTEELSFQYANQYPKSIDELKDSYKSFTDDNLLNFRIDSILVGLHEAKSAAPTPPSEAKQNKIDEFIKEVRLLKDTCNQSISINLNELINKHLGFLGQEKTDALFGKLSLKDVYIDAVSKAGLYLLEIASTNPRNNSSDKLSQEITEQRKIEDVLTLLSKSPLENLDSEKRAEIFNYIQNINTEELGEISPSERKNKERLSDLRGTFMWCAIFQKIKSRLPKTINELEKFIQVYFLKKDFSLNTGNESYLNIYKYAAASPLINPKFDLTALRKKALEPSLFIQNKQYDLEDNEAAVKIQHIFKLNLLWQSLLIKPQETYRTFSNDKIATEMFGKHVANSNDKKLNHNFITTDLLSARVKYYREWDGNKNSTFNMMPNDQELEIEVSAKGTGNTQWQNIIAEFGIDRYENTKTQKAIDILSRYAKNGEAILKSKELAKLKQVSSQNKSSLNFSLHAQEIYAIIVKVCSHPSLKLLDSQVPNIKTRIEDNLARLHMFLDILVNLHYNNHIKFTAMLEPIVHELSLLVYEITTELTSKPIVTYEEFNQAVQNEFLGEAGGIFAINQENDQIGVNGYPANSGMHANTLGLHLINKILDINDANANEHIFWEYNQEYEQYHEINGTREIILGGLTVRVNEDPTLPDIHAVNGSVLDGFSKYTHGVVNLREFVEKLLAKNSFHNNRHNVIFLDTTNSDYNNIKLDDKTQKLVNQGSLTIILWESWQKMGLLGTDQAQYGRVIVLSSKSHLQKLEPIKQLAEKDIIRLDMQIGALFQVSRKYHNKYREINFNNGKKMRDIVMADNPVERAKIGPFLTESSLSLVLDIYPSFPIYCRDSFGFNYVTFTESLFGFRVSAGSEPIIDIEIMSIALKKLVENTEGKSYKDKTKYLSELIDNLNDYFSKLNDKLIDFSKEEIKELISCLLLTQVVVDDGKYELALLNKLNNVNIIKICNMLLREKNNKVYNKLVNEYLEGSTKSISIITNLKSSLQNSSLQYNSDMRYLSASLNESIRL